MSRDAVQREVHLAFPAVPDKEVEASAAAASFAEAMRMSADKVDEIRLAVVEACINAIEHSEAADGTMYLTLEVVGTGEPEALRITIRDHGMGFDPSAVKEPDIHKVIHAPGKRGWGLKIIHGLMDDVEIRSDARGTTVVMIKSR
jgi:serine/threonine-protein kinase RsbW